LIFYCMFINTFVSDLVFLHYYYQLSTLIFIHNKIQLSFNK